MKFIQISADDGSLFALGDDGCIYRQTWFDKATGETEYNEYGGVANVMQRVYSWAKLPMPTEVTPGAGRAQAKGQAK